MQSEGPISADSCRLELHPTEAKEAREVKEEGMGMKTVFPLFFLLLLNSFSKV